MVFFVLKKTSSDISQHPEQEKASPQRVIRLQTQNFTPQVTGYGSLEPDKVWSALTQVEGTVVYTHPNLRAGKLVPAGAILIKLDPRPYQLVLDQARAESQRLQSELNQLKRQETNEQELVALEKQSFVLSQRSLERNKQLFSEQTISQSQLDNEERNLLKARYQLQILENSLSILPIKQQSIQALMKANLASIKRAELNLSYCEIKAPFTAIMANVALEKHQYVSVRQKLFEAYGHEFMKVDAQIPLHKLKQVLGDAAFGTLSRELNQQGAIQSIANLLTITVNFPGSSGLESKAQETVSWPAKLISIREEANENTRTLGLTILLDKKSLQSSAFPLLKGSYAEVVFQGQTQKDQVLIPAYAVHDGFVYVLDQNQRLKRRPVVIAQKQADQVVLKEGLQPGELLIVSDPEPAIEGLLIQPLENPPNPSEAL